MTTSAAYILIALIIASGSCKEPRLIARTMASLELCQAAANLVTKGGGLSDCVLAPAPDAPWPAPAVIIGDRNPLTATLGPRRSSASIVRSSVINRRR